MSEKKIYKIRPILQSTVWGGEKIKEYYGLDTKLSNVAQMYHVIALKNHLDNEIIGENCTLSEFYENNPKLFNCSCKEFPIRMATSCSEHKMSYHLHPDNAYAYEHEHCMGKVSGSIPYESKGIIKKSFFGHNAQTMEELKKMVEENDWGHFCRYIDVRDDQYFHTPAGVIHGGGEGGAISIVFSTNSDITYRLYDYGRNDPSRKLHIKQVYDCINMPEKELKPIDVMIEKKENLKISHYYDHAKEYTGLRLDISGKCNFECPYFAFYLVAKGEGTINGLQVKQGETIFVPSEFGKLNLDGVMKLYSISYRDN